MSCALCDRYFPVHGVPCTDARLMLPIHEGLAAASRGRALLGTVSGTGSALLVTADYARTWRPALSFAGDCETRPVAHVVILILRQDHQGGQSLLVRQLPVPCVQSNHTTRPWTESPPTTSPPRRQREHLRGRSRL